VLRLFQDGDLVAAGRGGASGSRLERTAGQASARGYAQRIDQASTSRANRRAACARSVDAGLSVHLLLNVSADPGAVNAIVRPPA